MRIGIIGSGFGAMAVALELLRHGYDDVRLWERADSIGGVWRDNTYPGAACDVPSIMYSLSYERRSTWSRRYATQPEILRYLHEVADQYDVPSRVALCHEVTQAHWDDEARTWTVGFADGTHDTVDVLVPAVGQLSRPSLPRIDGREDFAGPAFHSAEWDHAADLTGRVAVIGTGASAVQFVPHLAEVAREVTVFQRSANYLLPRPDGPYARWYRPFVRAERPPLEQVAQAFTLGLFTGSVVGRVNELICRAHLRHQVKDPALRAMLTPDYPIGCKRILFSSDYYPALSQPHVDLVTDPIDRITERGVIAAGTERPFDAIVYGTGFDAQDFLDSIAITGRDGRVLSEQWATGARAHLGIHVPGFPNLLVCYGPNTNLGGNSIIAMLEAQARHMRWVLDRMSSRGARTVEVTESAEQHWDDEVQALLETTAWASCQSWYRHPVSGRITSNWPGGPPAYARRTEQAEEREFAWS